MCDKLNIYTIHYPLESSLDSFGSGSVCFPTSDLSEGPLCAALSGAQSDRRRRGESENSLQVRATCPSLRGCVGRQFCVGIFTRPCAPSALRIRPRKADAQARPGPLPPHVRLCPLVPGSASDLGRALWACKELALLRHLVAICKNTLTQKH